MNKLILRTGSNEGVLFPDHVNLLEILKGAKIVNLTTLEPLKGIEFCVFEDLSEAHEEAMIEYEARAEMEKIFSEVFHSPVECQNKNAA